MEIVVLCRGKTEGLCGDLATVELVGVAKVDEGVTD